MAGSPVFSRITANCPLSVALGSRRLRAEFHFPDHRTDVEQAFARAGLLRRDTTCYLAEDSRSRRFGRHLRHHLTGIRCGSEKVRIEWNTGKQVELQRFCEL